MPLLTLAYVSRLALLKARGKLLRAGKIGKTILGAAMVTVAALILFGVDKSVEAWVVKHLPTRLMNLTTRF